MVESFWPSENDRRAENLPCRKNLELFGRKHKHRYLSHKSLLVLGSSGSRFDNNVWLRIRSRRNVSVVDVPTSLRMRNVGFALEDSQWGYSWSNSRKYTLQLVGLLYGLSYNGSVISSIRSLSKSAEIETTMHGFEVNLDQMVFGGKSIMIEPPSPPTVFRKIPTFSDSGFRELASWAVVGRFESSGDRSMVTDFFGYLQRPWQYSS